MAASFLQNSLQIDPALNIGKHILRQSLKQE